MKRFLIMLAVIALAGCSTLVPKKVEFFQDKVQTFPEQPAKLVELEREAIARALDKTAEVVVVATREKASTNVVAPAKEANTLVQAVATVIGPPEKPAPVTESSDKLAVRLESAVAKFSDTVQEFKLENNKNSGKKIEGTGLVQVSYVFWAGGIVLGVLALLLAGRFLLTLAASANPAAAAALTALNAAGAIAKKGASEVVTEVESAAKLVEEKVKDSGIKEEILAALTKTQVKAQDTHAVVQTLSDQ